MERLTSLMRADKEFKSFLSALESAYSEKESLPIAINGLTGGASTAFLTESVIEARKISSLPVLILCENEGEREKILSSLKASGINCLGYKKRDLVFHNIKASHDIERERLSVLSSLVCGSVDAVVATPSAASVYTMPKRLLCDLSVSLTLGDLLPPEELAKKLFALGFMHSEIVEGRGQFSRRGGILDFWCGEDKEPTRIEFFGDEIDRIARFDPVTQRTTDAVKNVKILPASETLVDAEARTKILENVNKLLQKATKEGEKERLMREIAVLKSDLAIDFRDKYMGVVYTERENLFSYFSSLGKCVAFVVGTNGALEDITNLLEHLREERDTLLSQHSVTEEAAVYSSGKEDYLSFLSSSMTVHLNPFAGGVGTMRLSGLFGFRCRRCVSYGSNASMLHEDLSSFVKGLYRVVIVAENKQGADSLASALNDADFAVTPIYDRPQIDPAQAEGGRIFITVGRCEGYDLIMPKIAVLSMAEDLGKMVMQNRRRQRILKQSGGAGKRLMSYADLSVGDYVVHANYGIGLFEGIETVTVDGFTKDYITIRYAGTDKLFVPCDRLELIGKYIGARDKDGKVKLSKMGGTEWHKTRTRAKSTAQDIAKKLILLYAERQRKPGFAFPADSDLEYAFADSFEFEETESQTQAIQEIKKDMQRPVPMNRLLCGDVGFGKTEVALRAAFKAIMGGKQVAILVPTTILALQHYETALSRMRGFPVTVEMLSRFKKPKEQAEILRKVKRGETDILIGTHKLLSKQLEFRDLGLLVIDEEQRFGVSQKERLKEMSKNVDVLTLTATPIPRTLNMAMNGISDISILDEAPGERRPVQTYVLEHDDTVVFDALRRELARGGQVLYLYNKVEDIDLKAGHLMKEMPEARIAYAHGQMEKEELEDIWQLLVRGDIDILVCTTIIETGVDLPNANTLIIENADRFGLSQLHQIRGRVGRSGRQAYAYFTYRVGKTLSEVAEKRLAAIKEYAEFGAGFKIALCDLEIRGAGNLLGTEQHGCIDSVGYDLYVKLLNEAVLEEKGEKPEEKPEAHINIKVNAHIPDHYIASSAQRMEMYKKISLITCAEDAMDISDEFLDRFGELPGSVERLISVSLMKALSERLGFSKVELSGGDLVFFTGRPDLSIWSEVFGKFAGMRIAPSGDRVIYRYSGQNAVGVGAEILKMYSRLKNESLKTE